MKNKKKVKRPLLRTKKIEGEECWDKIIESKREGIPVNLEYDKVNRVMRARW